MIVFFILARYFANRSVRPMAEAWESQRQFIANASHELKTPISTLNANLDILYASQEDTIEEQVKWLDNSKKVLSRMMALIQSMLELAKVDELSDNQNIEEVLINQLLDAVIKVQNTGDGIHPADIDKIFDRFYRGDKACVYKNGNYGLGLSIAKSVGQKLGGEISAESNSERTVFTMKIPNNKKSYHS